MKPYRDRSINADCCLDLLEPIVNQKTKVKVRCNCGNEYKVYPQTLFRENAIKCCSKCRDFNKYINYISIGGLRNHPAYNILDGMKQRCYNQKHKAYPEYGGIGIDICPEWLNDYNAFCSWADSNGFTKGLTIDRIDVNIGYNPLNCRFIQKSEQRENKHIQRNNTSGFTGVFFQKNIKKWFAYYTYKRRRINCGYYETAEEASKARENSLKEANINYKRVKYV